MQARLQLEIRTLTAVNGIAIGKAAKGKIDSGINLRTRLDNRVAYFKWVRRNSGAATAIKLEKLQFQMVTPGNPPARAAPKDILAVFDAQNFLELDAGLRRKYIAIDRDG